MYIPIPRETLKTACGAGVISMFLTIERFTPGLKFISQLLDSAR